MFSWDVKIVLVPNGRRDTQSLPFFPTSPFRISKECKATMNKVKFFWSSYKCFCVSVLHVAIKGSVKRRFKMIVFFQKLTPSVIIAGSISLRNYSSQMSFFLVSFGMYSYMKCNLHQTWTRTTCRHGFWPHPSEFHSFACFFFLETELVADSASCDLTCLAE